MIAVLNNPTIPIMARIMFDSFQIIAVAASLGCVNVMNVGDKKRRQ